jgi:8-oxo-dGTP pyrophosphatase MutT (NUDIX family)
MLVTHEAFIAVVDTDVVTLNHEHDDFRWAEPDDLKEYLHTEQLRSRAMASDDFASWLDAWRSAVLALEQRLSGGTSDVGPRAL